MKILILALIFTSCAFGRHKPKVVYKTKVVTKEVIKEPEFVPREKIVDECIERKFKLGFGPKTAFDICNKTFRPNQSE